jgi:serine phosphatase RsbU (regulator of sigma subunit)
VTAEVDPAATVPSGDARGGGNSVDRVVLDAISARRRVDEALAIDRVATGLLYVAQTRLAQAERDLAAAAVSGDATERRQVDEAVEVATAELAASGEHRARCREALSEALDGLAATDTPSRRGFGGEYSSSPAAAAVVAEATAIAATAQESLAAELHAATVQAAKTAEQAVAAAAATVARAAAVSRQSRRTADTLAAADVAAEAAATATSLQVHADVLAAVVAATARVAAEQLPHPGTEAATSLAARLAGQVTATAQSQADETAAAARIVASAVAADAAAVAAVTSATAGGIEQDVLAAAAAVQAVADAAALDLSLPTSLRAWESAARSLTDQRSAKTEHAAADAAATAATAARCARTSRLDAAAEAAATVAQAAAHTAAAVHTRAMERADVAAADSVAAALIVSMSASGNLAEVDAANLVRSVVMAAAVAAAEQTSLAAALVARSVAATAEAMQARTAAEEILIERHVRDTAVAVQAITTATAVQLAAATLERESSIALTTRAAAAATERVLEANRQLESAGRHDRAVAVALQRAMLSELPQPAGMTMAARYVTAVEQDQVGGDWYDALLLPTGAVTLVVGDVVGHDITAAAMMGQLRTALRTLAWENGHPPSVVVSRLDALVRDWHLDTLATLILVNVDEPGATDGSSVATLRWTNAGHPAPILIHTDGTGLVLDDATDIILGVEPASTRHDHTHQVPPGATLLLYTDGLIETRTQPHHQGRQRLLDTVRTHKELELNELLDTVLSDMIDENSADDIAVLAVRFGNQPLTTNTL